jgi:hypothetical protein
MSSHFASLKSERLQRLLKAFEIYANPTTIVLQEYTKSCNISADITEARKNGINIKCRYLGERGGRRVSEFYIENQIELALA